MNEDRAARRADARLYLVGFVLAVVLSAIPFCGVAFGLMAPSGLLWAIVICGLMQVVVHFRCFLHIDLSSNHRHDLELILFSAGIILLMVGGTLWISHSQMAMMAPGPHPSQMGAPAS